MPGLAPPSSPRRNPLGGNQRRRTQRCAGGQRPTGIGLAILTAALLPGRARAEEQACRGSLGAIAVDNLRVPQGATCHLEGTRAWREPSRSKRNARLFAAAFGSRSNVQAENARRVNVVRSSRINGAVEEVDKARACEDRVQQDRRNLVYKQQDGPSFRRCGTTSRAQSRCSATRAAPGSTETSWTATCSARRTSPRRRATETSSAG